MILKVYKSSSILSVTLLTLGSHIGERLTAHYYQFSISYYIRCIRQTFFIIDIAKTLIHLKKALHFVKHLASRNYNILFYHSSIYKVSYLKSIFHFIVTLKTNNSYIGYK